MAAPLLSLHTLAAPLRMGLRLRACGAAPRKAPAR